MIATVESGSLRRQHTRDSALIAILAAALIARWVAVMVLDPGLFAGTWEYEEVALNLLNGNGFVGTYAGTAYRALVHPIYPAFCAVVYWLVGHPSLLAIQIVQSLVVVPAGFVAFDLASTLAGRRAGLLAAVGMTLHPSLMIFSLRRHALWFDAVIFLVSLWATFRLRSSARLSRSIALGALFGAGLLSRATVAVFMGAACAWLVWQWRTPLRVSLIQVAAIAGTAFVVAAPWLIRNAVVLQQPVGFISTTPYGLWIGNNPAATTGALAADGTTAIAYTAPALLGSLRGRDELQQQQIYWNAATQYIANNPGTAAANYGRKLWSFLFWSEQTGALYPRSFRVAYQAFYLLLLAAAMVGAYTLTRSGNAAAVVLCVSFVLSVGLVQSIFFVEGRHRWEVESGLVVLASCGLGARAAARAESRAA